MSEKDLLFSHDDLQDELDAALAEELDDHGFDDGEAPVDDDDAEEEDAEAEDDEMADVEGGGAER